MEIGRAFNHLNTMAQLNLLGFSDVHAGKHGFTNFRFLGDPYEVIRYEREICLAHSLPTESFYEIFGYMTALEEILDSFPKLQGYYSEDEDVFKLRIWLPYEDSKLFGAALRRGIDFLSSVSERFEDAMLNRVFDAYRPLFEKALVIKDDNEEDDF